MHVRGRSVYVWIVCSADCSADCLFGRLACDDIARWNNLTATLVPRCGRRPDRPSVTERAKVSLSPRLSLRLVFAPYFTHRRPPPRARPHRTCARRIACPPYPVYRIPYPVFAVCRCGTAHA
eukprot:359900-Chlamydomonas_euryale.AAC.10